MAAITAKASACHGRRRDDASQAPSAIPTDPVEQLFASYRAAFMRYERRPTVERWRVAMNAFVNFNAAFIAECEGGAE